MTTQTATGSTIERPAESATGAARVVRVLALWAAALALAGCDVVGRSVELVGDSTAYELVSPLVQELTLSDVSRPGDVVIPLATVPGFALGEHGAYFEGRLRTAREPAGDIPGPKLQPPCWMVISLLTNDVGDGRWPGIDEPAEQDAAIDRLLAVVPARTRVLWVVPIAPVILPERRASVEAALLRATDRWPKLHLLYPDPAWYFEGDVHFSPEGRGLLAHAIGAKFREVEEAELATFLAAQP